MIDAIKESERGAMTVTKRSESLQYEPPSIIICPKPGLKPSISKQYNLNIPAGDIFTWSSWLDNENLDVDLLHTRDVEEFYDEFQYGDGLTFNFGGTDLKFGKNEIMMRHEGHKV